MLIAIDIPKEEYKRAINGKLEGNDLTSYIKDGTPLTLKTLADALMEERIRGKLDSDITFEKDVIRDVKCRLTVSIRDHRPCYCGAELGEVCRKS